MGDLSKYFNKSEMVCKCGCGKLNMGAGFMSKLDLARGFSGTSFIVNSGYRCAEYNKSVGGKPGSAHTKGLAADIRSANSIKRFKIVKGLIEAGFTRIGIGFNDEFVHADLDTIKAQEVMWGY